MFVVVKRKIVAFWLISIALAILISVLAYPKPIKVNLPIEGTQNTIVIDAGHSK
jgi:hypothetical protein